MRVVFMGTPEFAVPSLKALLDAGYGVVGVFTPVSYTHLDVYKRQVRC